MKVNNYSGSEDGENLEKNMQNITANLAYVT